MSHRTRAVQGSTTPSASAAPNAVTHNARTTSTGSNATTGTAGGGGSNITITGASSRTTQARMGQILDDQDHKRCSEGNQRALLAEKLDQLRGLVKVLEADDWKYTSSATNSHLPMSKHQ